MSAFLIIGIMCLQLCIIKTDSNMLYCKNGCKPNLSYFIQKNRGVNNINETLQKDFSLYELKNNESNLLNYITLNSSKNWKNQIKSWFKNTEENRTGLRMKSLCFSVY